MIEVNFCRAPSHYWVGWCTYENGTYYASGNTLDTMLYCIKRSLWTKKRISVRGVVLASKQSEPGDAPLQLFKNMFKTKYWFGNGDTQDKTKEQTKSTEKPIGPASVMKYDYYDTRVENGVLVVYGIARHRVAEYKLNPDSILPPVTVPDVPAKPYNGVIENGVDNEGQGHQIL